MSDTILEMKLRPFVIPEKHPEQKLMLKLNNQDLASWVLREPQAKIYSVLLPSSMLRVKNVLTLQLPNAIKPSSLKLNMDPQLLAISMQWMQLAQQSRPRTLSVPPISQFPASRTSD
jgi:hypothetical protein